MTIPASGVDLTALNSFGVSARAQHLLRVRSLGDLTALLQDEVWRAQPICILGGGSNTLFVQEQIPGLVLKIELLGRAVAERSDAWIIEAASGENWADLVDWSLSQGASGLENLAQIPGSVGAAAAMNIGAYGLEISERFEALETFDLMTGRLVRLEKKQMHFDYRTSIFKQALRGKSVITRVWLRLPKPWRTRLGYADLERRAATHARDTKIAGGITARMIYEWVSSLRREKLPNPQNEGNAGSFFKNPSVSTAHCRELLEIEPQLVHYKLSAEHCKLSAAWMIESLGWRGRALGNAAVSQRHALVLVNRGGPSVRGQEILALAKNIQADVLERFGILLEPEPVLV